MVLKKAEIELSLQEEARLIQDGKLKEDNPLDLSLPFTKLCEACRKGDLKTCQEQLQAGVNINAKDLYDYTPLILASLCGHYEVVQLLLESGALCERDTFQGERCLYNALNDRIRNLLLEYDYSKSTDPLQPLAAHVASLLSRQHPQTADLVVVTARQAVFRLHKFLLSARSPYFARKLAHNSAGSNVVSWKLPSAIPSQIFQIAVQHLYLGELPAHIESGDPDSESTEDELLEGIDRISRQLEMPHLWHDVLESDDRRLARQRRTDELNRGQKQLETWFCSNILKNKIVTDINAASSIRWDRQNAIFADVLLRADESSTIDSEDAGNLQTQHSVSTTPIGPAQSVPSSKPSAKESVLFPAHRAMLLRSEFFLAMFSSTFREASDTAYLQIIPIDCTPSILEIVLRYLYTEDTNIPLWAAIDVLYIADLLFLDKLKSRAALVISTLGDGVLPKRQSTIVDGAPSGLEDDQANDNGFDIYGVLHAAWQLRVPRLEEFVARYFARHLEYYIDSSEFADVVRQSASRIRQRQETDTIELVDDIRYYLGERFRLRFEDTGMDELMNEESKENAGSDEKDFAKEIELLRASVNRAEGAPCAVSSKDLKDSKDSVLVATRLSNLQKESSDDNTIWDSTPPQNGDARPDSDTLAQDAWQHEMLLGKIDDLLASLQLDA